jgi:hypothetical protein
MKIKELEERAMLAELDMPAIWNTDYSKFNTLKIPRDVQLTTEDKSEMIIETKNGKKMFAAKPIAFYENDFNGISDYLQREVDKGHQIWIRRIATHKEGRKFTILESIIINKLIL